MHIRPFRDSDEEFVINLWQLCDLTRTWNDPRKDIARKRTVQRELFLVGELDQIIVACAMGGYDGHRGWVNYLAVDPQYRRQGLGQRMMQALEQQLLGLGCPKLNLQVRTTNQQVLGFYLAIGYQQDDVVSMGKRLIVD